MDYAYRMYRNVKFYYNQINPATLSGAIDVIVVEQPNHELLSTPFHVRFGKYGVFNPTEKYVDVMINGKEVDLRMKLGENGVAFFVEKTDENVPDYMVTSPLPGAGATKPATEKVLEESARTLERHARAQEVGAKETQRSKSCVRSPSPKRDDKVSLEISRKMTLPFSSSVFSARKNRSLPDLSTLTSSRKEKRERKEDAGTGTTGTTTPGKRNVPALRHSKSQALSADKILKDDDLKTAEEKSAEDHTQEDRSDRSDSLSDTLPRTERSKRNSDKSDKSDDKTARAEGSPGGSPGKASTRSGFVPSAPIAIKVPVDDDRCSSSSSTSSLSSNPASPAFMDDADRIAEGALSDSEVDRHRNSPPAHGSDVTNWQWGQFPETRDDQKKEPEKPKQTSYWNWWWRNKPNSASQEEQGIYLDDLITTRDSSDPRKIEKYLGKAGGSSALSADNDSGNGSSSTMTTSPSSPAATSHEELRIDDTTPTQESVTSALLQKEKKANQPKQRHHSEGHRSGSTTSDSRPLSDEEDLAQDFSMKFIRSLRLSSDRLKTLGLKMGANECRFSITTKFQGTTWAQCNIYLYKHSDKLVISDIDGTITKSDVLGHVIPAIGGQWAHVGVAELYTKIKQNGYRLIYLSSRAIGQSAMTKQYLKTVEQGSRVLPDGPVLLAPDSVLVAFRREVIERRPEEFKIAALTDLKKLFPVKSPFFAGFGNRETDVTSYKAVGVDPSRILIIDPSGKLRRSDSGTYVSSYMSMAQDSVDYLFPPFVDETSRTARGFSRPQTSSSFTHWRAARDSNSVSLTDVELEAYEEKRKKLAAAAKGKKK